MISARTFFWFLVAVSCLAPSAHACNVPLFRYALEHWRPENYHFIVFHEGPLDAAHKKTVDDLRDYSNKLDCGTNFMIENIDFRDYPKDKAPVTKLFGISQMPWLVIRYPAKDATAPVAWSGPLANAPIEKLMDSPARREIARRLLGGESAVWVLIETGDKTSDDAAAKTLTDNLKKLEATLELPKLTSSPKDKLLREDLPLRIGFSILRLNRDDPAEAMLVHLLLHTESDLAERKEPMAFPIFGRGIVLYGLIGKGINDDTIGEAAGLLVGACRCEIKKLNPGVDLLMTTYWGDGMESPAPEIAIGRFTSGPSAVWRNLLVVALSGVVLVAAATSILYVRRRRLT